MSSFHKPRMFRSQNGCCICKAKSSSSRFTDSGRYSQSFSLCFRLSEEREGDICNACVLLVKRWRKLPGTSTRHWAHVVDARMGPGTKSIVKRKKEEAGPTQAKRGRKKKEKEKREKEEEEEKKVDRRRIKPPTRLNTEMRNRATLTDLIDLTIWKRESVCCGTAYYGPKNLVLVDKSAYSPCPFNADSHLQPKSVALFQPDSQRASKTDTVRPECATSTSLVHAASTNNTNSTHTASANSSHPTARRPRIAPLLNIERIIEEELRAFHRVKSVGNNNKENNNDDNEDDDDGSEIDEGFFDRNSKSPDSTSSEPGCSSSKQQVQDPPGSFRKQKIMY